MGHRRKNRLVSLALALVMAIAMLGSAPTAAFGEVESAGSARAQAAPRAFNDDEPRFQLTVSIPEGGATFILPTSSYLNGTNSGKAYDWAIDWGDGKTDNASGASSNGGGIPHHYEFAGDHIITITPNGSTEAWLAAFGFYGSAEGSNAPANKDLVTAVSGPLTPQMTRTTDQINGISRAPSYEWAYIFSSCYNLSQLPIVEGWEQVTTVDDYFADYMFYNCISLTFLADGFNLPQGITSAGSFFANSMFNACYNLVSLPAGFNLPQGIVAVGSEFVVFMFMGCSELRNLPDGFNLPQGITYAGFGFAAYMFYQCYSLESLPAGFNLPPGMTAVGDNFAAAMFYTCESLAELPEGFNLPQGITSVGSDFASGLLSRCYSLRNLPESFNLPQGITSVGDSFAMLLFNYCTRLTTLPEGFNLPQGITITGGDFAYGMFIACESLVSLPEDFSLPYNISSAGLNFAAEMFRDAGSADFQINDEFRFPAGIPADTELAFYRSFQLSEAAPMQNRTAASIIGDCPVPADPRDTFDSHFSDLDLIPINWGGLTPIENEQVFRLTIKTPLNNLAYILPTSSLLNGTYEGKPYDWNVDWGDGSSDIYTGFSSFNSGITHNYSIAGDYTITIRPNGSTEAWLAAFGYSAEYIEGKFYLIAVSGPIRPQMTRTSAQIDGTDAPPDYEWNQAFCNCNGLQTIPAFEGWEDIGSVGDNFAASMFNNCHGLTSLPEGVTLPQGITKAGDFFAAGMFNNCPNLTSLPDGFNLPQALTEAGDQFAYSMFTYCTSLASLPDGFNLPQGITEVGDQFAGGMFINCLSLTSLPDSFNLPQGVTTAGNYFAAGMFANCSSLDSLPAGFNLPQHINKVDIGFASQMFYAAGSVDFQINDGFRFPAGISADATLAFFYTFQLSENAPMQNRTAASIIGDCPTPANSRDTFDAHFSDLESIAFNWGNRYTPPPVGEPGSGDLNGDGFVTMDEVLITAYAAIGAAQLTPRQFAAIDMDNDGAITMADVMLVYQASVM